MLEVLDAVRTLGDDGNGLVFPMQSESR